MAELPTTETNIEAFITPDIEVARSADLALIVTRPSDGQPEFSLDPVIAAETGPTLTVARTIGQVIIDRAEPAPALPEADQLALERRPSAARSLRRRATSALGVAVAALGVSSLDAASGQEAQATPASVPAHLMRPSLLLENDVMGTYMSVIGGPGGGFPPGNFGAEGRIANLVAGQHSLRFDGPCGHLAKGTDNYVGANDVKYYRDSPVPGDMVIRTCAGANFEPAHTVRYSQRTICRDYQANLHDNGYPVSGCLNLDGSQVVASYGNEAALSAGIPTSAIGTPTRLAFHDFGANLTVSYNRGTTPGIHYLKSLVLDVKHHPETASESWY